jgi:hypothetical protein
MSGTLTDPDDDGDFLDQDIVYLTGTTDNPGPVIADELFPVNFSPLLLSPSLTILADDGTQAGYINVADLTSAVLANLIASGVVTGAIEEATSIIEAEVADETIDGGVA